MSRYYRNEEEQRGYDDRKEADRWASYPYERSHDYREGWDDAARDERRAQERREEERAEQEAAERAEERRQHEAAQMRRAEEEQFYEQQRPEPTPEPDHSMQDESSNRKQGTDPEAEQAQLAPARGCISAIQTGASDSNVSGAGGVSEAEAMRQALLAMCRKIGYDVADDCRPMDIAEWVRDYAGDQLLALHLALFELEIAAQNYRTHHGLQHSGRCRVVTVNPRADCTCGLPLMFLALSKARQALDEARAAGVEPKDPRHEPALRKYNDKLTP